MAAARVSVRKSPPAFWKSIALGFPGAAKPSTMLAMHGAAGPYGWLVLILTAKRQAYDELDKTARRPGRVKLGWPAFAQIIGVDVVEARAVLETLSELDEIVVEDIGHGFVAQLVDWDRWEIEPADPKAAAAKRVSRSRPVSGQRPDGGTHKDKDKDELPREGARE